MLNNVHYLLKVLAAHLGWWRCITKMNSRENRRCFIANNENSRHTSLCWGCRKGPSRVKQATIEHNFNVGDFRVREDGCPSEMITTSKGRIIDLLFYGWQHWTRVMNIVVRISEVSLLQTGICKNPEFWVGYKDCVSDKQTRGVYVDLADVFTDFDDHPLPSRTNVWKGVLVQHMVSYLVRRDLWYRGLRLVCISNILKWLWWNGHSEWRTAPST